MVWTNFGDEMNLLREARYCFVHGQFAAAVALANAFAERTLIAELVDRDPEIGPRVGWPKALAAAKRLQVFPELLPRIEALATTRQAYLHLRMPDDPETVGMKALLGRRHPASVREQDAKDALLVMHDVYRAAIRVAE